MGERTPLTPERLEQLLNQLDEVMGEASRLRGEITRQLDEQRRTVQQKVTPSRKRGAKHR